MIHGAHVILYSKDFDADRDFFRDVLEYPSVDAGGGWLIFAMPPAELAVHPAETNGKHELYFMCDDIQAFLRAMAAKGVACSPIHEERWGSLTQVTLPGGGTLGVYQPKHASPLASKKRTATKKTVARKASSKKTAAKKKTASKKGRRGAR